MNLVDGYSSNDELEDYDDINDQIDQDLELTKLSSLPALPEEISNLYLNNGPIPKKKINYIYCDWYPNSNPYVTLELVNLINSIIDNDDDDDTSNKLQKMEFKSFLHSTTITKKNDDDDKPLHISLSHNFHLEPFKIEIFIQQVKLILSRYINGVENRILVPYPKLTGEFKILDSISSHRKFLLLFIMIPNDHDDDDMINELNRLIKNYYSDYIDYKADMLHTSIAEVIGDDDDEKSEIVQKLRGMGIGIEGIYLRTSFDTRVRLL